MAQKTNARQIFPTSVANALSPANDICGSNGCGHDGPHHGTTGACRFSKTCGCTGFVPKEN